MEIRTEDLLARNKKDKRSQEMRFLVPLMLLVFRFFLQVSVNPGGYGKGPAVQDSTEDGYIRGFEHHFRVYGCISPA
jgi:hypothetical protein